MPAEMPEIRPTSVIAKFFEEQGQKFNFPVDKDSNEYLFGIWHAHQGITQQSTYSYYKYSSGFYQMGYDDANGT